YRGDFPFYYLLGGVWGYYKPPPCQGFFPKRFTASPNFSPEVYVCFNVFYDIGYGIPKEVLE
ncbi:hypothetical protein, partial [Thermocrinis sp.]|uniref:hypothetical protein n=1 Tax=Thermocrinis sp. TaxID=2024383 RepID=UPI002629853B